MNELETQLNESLRRIDPPAGFSNRVMHRIAVEPRKTRLLAFPIRQTPTQVQIGSLAASLLLSVLLAGGIEHRHRTDERARAQRDFARSLEITDRVMQQTRQRLQQAGVPLDD